MTHAHLTFLNSLLAITLIFSGALPSNSVAGEGKADELMRQALDAQLDGKSTEALALVSKAIEADPKNTHYHYLRGRLYVDQREPAKAIVDFDQTLKGEPQATTVYQLRGEEHFKLGHFKESIADFDKVIELVPDRAAQHWQRGIALYCAGRFEEGRKQFELHQTVNSNDVENAVWHYLCVARASGVAKARESLIAIKGDGRIPMMQVHALYAGKATPDEIMAAANAGQPSKAELNQRLFYADLYLGLYYEAAGNEKLAREHLLKADEYKIEDYMGDVARVHAGQLREKVKP